MSNGCFCCFSGLGQSFQRPELRPERSFVSGPGTGRGSIVVDNPGRLVDFYDMQKKPLGEGSYGTVCKATLRSSNAIRAVKSIPRGDKKSQERFRHEIAIMKAMDHPNILRLFETFEDKRNFYLVMELASGGELFDKIVEVFDKGQFTETQAATLMEQLARAVFHMHSIWICHRDLKPENFLFMEQKRGIENNTLKIIDFGLSCQFSPDSVLTTKAGTPYYVAPQVLAGKYDEKCDTWSLGVIMYVLLSGTPPFFGESDAEVLKKVRQGNVSFKAQEWNNISEDAKNLIRALLKMQPKDRYTAKQALEHVWIKEKAPKAPVGVSLQTSFIDNLRGFRSANLLKKKALQIIAGSLDDEHIKCLKEAFISMDTDGDGFLTPAEVKEGLHKSAIGTIPADLQALLDSVDSDGSGQIDYTEFLAASLERRVYLKKEALWAAFRVFDKNGDGKISEEELKLVMQDDDIKSAGSAEMLQKMMQEADLDGDGNIDFDEFTKMMGST